MQSRDARAGVVREEAAVRVVMFDDMRGSTMLKERLAEHSDEEAFHELRREHDRLVAEVIGQTDGGEVVKSTGDGLIVLFDRPSLAVERAIEIQERLKGHPNLRVRIGLDMGEVKIAVAEGRPIDAFGRHVDWASRACSLARDGHVCVTRPVYDDAFSWITKSRIAWKAHGRYIVKAAESPLEIFEPYNANSTRPLRSLRGERVADSRPSKRPVVAAQAEPAGTVVRPWEMVARDGREFAQNGAGVLYWFRVPLGGISYPEGFRSFLQPALENDRITKIRFVLDASMPPIRRVWEQLVLPLVLEWGAGKGRSLAADKSERQGRIVLEDRSAKALSWVFVDLSREFTPCFKLLVPDLETDDVTDSEAQIFLSTATRTVWLADGSEEIIRVPDAVLRIRPGEHEPVLHTLNAVANQWDTLFG